MKKKGCKFEYEKEMREDMMRSYREALSAARLGESKRAVIRRAINSPSKRFWVSEYRADIVMGMMMRGAEFGNMRPNTREMYEEIYGRVMRLMKLDPKRNRIDVVCEVVNQPAPRFYLTVDSFKVLMHKMKKQWFEERKRKVLDLRQQS